MDNFKYYIGEILEINYGFEYETKYILKLYEDESTNEHKIEWNELEGR